MRIGLLTTSFPRFEGDVAGHFVLGFARALAACGHQLEVLAPEPREALPAPRWPGIDVQFVPYMRPRRAARSFYGAGVPDNLRLDPLAWLGLLPFCAALYVAARARRAHWDALVSHWALPSALIAGAVCETRPHLAVLHSADMHLLSRLPLRARLAERLVSSADRLLFVSHAQRDRFVSWLPASERARAEFMVQPMGYAPTAHSAVDRDVLRSQLGLNGFTLLTLARLVPVKGLFEALCELSKRAELTWLIAGDGPERTRLQALARGTKLRVRLLGVVTGAEKQALLRACDAFVLPSRVLGSGRSEGVPTALLEAMAEGLPVIASSVGGIPEIVRDGETGLLFEPECRGALSACVSRLAADPMLARELAQRARRTAAAHEWSAIGNALSDALSKPKPLP